MSGPSGVGKSTVLESLATHTQFVFSVSATTRAPRPGEIDGEDYFFLDRPRFEEMIANDELFEWAEYAGHLYGTPRRWVIEQLEAGSDVALDIENDGAAQIKNAYPDAVLVFLLPPSMAELERRLRSRGDTDDEDVRRRLAVAEGQIADAQRNFDHLIESTDVATVASRLASILRASRSR